MNEEEVVEALNRGHEAIKQTVITIDDLAKEAGTTKLKVAKKEIGHDFYREVEEKVLVPLTEAMRLRGKLENYDRVDQVLDELVAALPEGEVQRKVEAKQIFKDLKEKVLRDEVLQHGVRLDGRAFDQVRPIWIETSVLPRTHGSAVFTRGETQALVTCTLGTADDEQKIEVRGIYKRFAPLHSRRSRSGRGSCVGRAAAKSVTARWPSARSSPCCLPRSSSPTPYEWFRTFSSRTGHRRWRRSAAGRSR